MRKELQLNIKTKGKEHLCKGCNGDGTASSGCSTFQALPKVDTEREKGLKYSEIYHKLEKEENKNCHPKSSIYSPAKFHRQGA